MQKFDFIKVSLVIFLIILCLVSTVYGETLRLIDLDFKNADLKDVLRALANQEGVSLVIDNEVSGPVTIHLTKVTFNDALAILAKNYNLTYIRENKVYHISRSELLKVEYQDGLLSVEARDAKLRTLIETVSQKTGVNLVPAPEISERISIIILKATVADGINTILTQANCTEEKIGQVSFIKKRASDRSFKVKYQAKLLSIDAQGIPLNVLAREITEKTGISVVPDQSLNLNANIFFQDLSVEDGLSILCETNGLLLLNEGLAYRIAKKTGSYRVVLKNNLLSVDCDNADVVAIINEIARQSGNNIILARDVQGQLTAHFQNLPFFQGLTAMLENRNLSLEKQADYYYVKTNPNNNPNMRISFDPEKKLYDLDVQTAPVATIINEMARKANLSMVVMAQVNWTVSNLRLQKLEFTQALDFLLKGTVFTYKLIGNTYLVGDGMVIRPENSDFAMVQVYPVKYLKADQFLTTLPPIFPKQNFVLMADKNAIIVTAPPTVHAMFNNYLEQVDVESIENRTEVIKVKYLKAEDVLKLIPPAIPKNDLIVIKEANAIAVTGPQNLINQVKQYISKVDQVNPMIVFDVMVVQISDSHGFTWKAPSGLIELSDGNKLKISPADPSISLIDPGSTPSATDSTIAQLTMLVQNGKGKILANPTISTLNGYQTSFSVSTKWSYSVPTGTTNGEVVNESVKTYDSGLFITIVPWVSADNQITMEIKPKISEFGDSPKDSNLPSTSERTTETTIRVNNKQTVVISGLRNSRKQKTITKIPILGDIPLLGYLFKNNVDTETQDEFVIVITPYLVFNEADRIEADQKIFSQYNLGVQTELKPEETADKKKKKQK